LNLFPIQNKLILVSYYVTSDGGGFLVFQKIGPLINRKSLGLRNLSLIDGFNLPDRERLSLEPRTIGEGFLDYGRSVLKLEMLIKLSSHTVPAESCLDEHLPRFLFLVLLIFKFVVLNICHRNSSLIPEPVNRISIERHERYSESWHYRLVHSNMLPEIYGRFLRASDPHKRVIVPALVLSHTPRRQIIIIGRSLEIDLLNGMFLLSLLVSVRSNPFNIVNLDATLQGVVRVNYNFLGLHIH
jgi:hypothetical protein